MFFNLSFSLLSYITAKNENNLVHTLFNFFFFDLSTYLNLKYITNRKLISVTITLEKANKKGLRDATPKISGTSLKKTTAK